MTDDDHTLVGDQPWQDLGERELTVLPQRPLLDPRTEQAIRAGCWTLVAIGLTLLAILLIAAAGLVVAIFGTGSL